MWNRIYRVDSAVKNEFFDLTIPLRWKIQFFPKIAPSFEWNCKYLVINIDTILQYSKMNFNQRHDFLKNLCYTIFEFVGYQWWHVIFNIWILQILHNFYLYKWYLFIFEVLKHDLWVELSRNLDFSLFLLFRNTRNKKSKKNQNLKDLVSFGMLNNVEISNENNSYGLVFFSFSLSSFWRYKNNS